MAKESETTVQDHAPDPSSADAPSPDAPIGLSDGATLALGAALTRLVSPTPKESPAPRPSTTKSDPPRKRQRASSTTPRPSKFLSNSAIPPSTLKQNGTAPRKRRKTSSAPRVLTADADVTKLLSDEREEKRRAKEAKIARLQFESNARVIPDAATNAAMERLLLATATRGAVTLFNAVAKAQKAAAAVVRTSDGKKKGMPVTREGFMKMMKEGIAKSSKVSESSAVIVREKEGGGEEEEEAERRIAKGGSNSAKWLKDDYLISRAQKGREWDEEEVEDESTDESEEDSMEEDDKSLNASDDDSDILSDGREDVVTEEEEENELESEA